MKLTLPLPVRELHPNWRGHWAKRAKAVKAARGRSHIEAIACPPPASSLPWPSARMTAFFYYPDRRKRDDDGAMASLKAYRDGLQDAGLVADDNAIVSVFGGWDVDACNPRVEITLERVEQKGEAA